MERVGYYDERVGNERIGLVKSEGGNSGGGNPPTLPLTYLTNTLL